MAEILRLIARAEPLDVLLERVASTIVSRFAIKSLTICLWDDDTGYFRPGLVHGFAEDQTRAIREHAYTLERKRDELQQKFRMSRDCYYVRAEELTQSYNDDVDYIDDVSEMNEPKESGDEWHDLDYIDFLMRDRLGNLIGWIEIDEPQNRQALPPDVLWRIQNISRLTAIAVENSKICDDAIASVGESQGYLDLIVRDIGNLIDPLAYYLDLRKEDSSIGDDASARLDKARALVKEAKAVVNNVRKLSEARYGGAGTKQAYDLKQVLIKCIACIERDFPEKDLVVDFDCPDNECRVVADDLIPDLFSNILGNAVKYSHGDKAEVDVAVSKGHDAWIVRIEDQGIGISDDRKELVFSRFAKRAGGAGGSGLGLSIVSLLVDQYNGLITLKDRVTGDHTQGASFEIALPKAPD